MHFILYVQDSNCGISVILPDGPWRELQLGRNSKISGESLSWSVGICYFYSILIGNFSVVYEILFSWSSVGIGLAFGIASVLWLGYIFNDTVIEIALTLAVSYIAYFTVRSSPTEE